MRSGVLLIAIAATLLGCARPSPAPRECRDEVGPTCGAVTGLCNEPRSSRDPMAPELAATGSCLPPRAAAQPQRGR